MAVCVPAGFTPARDNQLKTPPHGSAPSLEIPKGLRILISSPSDLSCRSLVTQDFLDYCCGVGGYVGLGGDGLTGDLDGDLA